MEHNENYQSLQSPEWLFTISLTLVSPRIHPPRQTLSLGTIWPREFEGISLMVWIRFALGRRVLFGFSLWDNWVFFSYLFFFFISGRRTSLLFFPFLFIEFGINVFVGEILTLLLQIPLLTVDTCLSGRSDCSWVSELRRVFYCYFLTYPHIPSHGSWVDCLVTATIFFLFGSLISIFFLSS